MIFNKNQGMIIECCERSSRLQCANIEAFDKILSKVLTDCLLGDIMALRKVYSRFR